MVYMGVYVLPILTLLSMGVHVLLILTLLSMGVHVLPSLNQPWVYMCYPS